MCVRYNFDEFLDALLRHGVTHAPLVPPILLQLVKNNLGAHFDRTKLKLKTVLTAAAPLGTELQKAFESKFPGVEVQQVMQQITLKLSQRIIADMDADSTICHPIPLSMSNDERLNLPKN